MPFSLTGDVELAVLQRLTGRVSAGVEVATEWQLEPASAPRAVTLTAGAWPWPKMGPTVRVWLGGNWSIDLVAQLSTGTTTLIAGAAVVWAPQILP